MNPLNNQNFINWFGKSVTIDKYNNPLVFYHKSRSKKLFYFFELEGNIEKNPFNSDYGVYFVKKEYAHYVQHLGEGIDFLCYLKILNPFTIHDVNGKSHDMNGNSYEYISLHKEFCLDKINKGYDAIIITNISYTQYIVFNSNQIKHINNIGSFSEESKNIFV